MLNKLIFLSGAKKKEANLSGWHARTFANQDSYLHRYTQNVGEVAWVPDESWNAASPNVVHDDILTVTSFVGVIGTNPEEMYIKLNAQTDVNPGYGYILDYPEYRMQHDSVDKGYIINFKHQAVFDLTGSDPDSVHSTYRVVSILGGDSYENLMRLQCVQYGSGIAEYTLYVRDIDNTVQHTVAVSTPLSNSPVDVLIQVREGNTFFFISQGASALGAAALENPFIPYRDNGDSVFEIFLPDNVEHVPMYAHIHDLVITKITG